MTLLRLKVLNWLLSHFANVHNDYASKRFFYQTIATKVAADFVVLQTIAESKITGYTFKEKKKHTIQQCEWVFMTRWLKINFLDVNIHFNFPNDDHALTEFFNLAKVYGDND